MCVHTFDPILFRVVVLAHRLSGLSPFMGATDVDTMTNVTVGNYDFDDSSFDSVSETAKNFVRALLLKDGE